MEISGLNLFREALKNLRRNLTVSVTSTFTVTSILFILGLFLLMVFNIKIGIIGLYSKSEIQVTLKDNIKTSDKENVQTCESKCSRSKLLGFAS
jgi:cell division protein FtsX